MSSIVVYTREELRNYVVSRLDWVIGHPWISGLSKDDLVMLKAQRKLFMTDDDVVDKLNTEVQRQQRGYSDEVSDIRPGPGDDGPRLPLGQSTTTPGPADPGLCEGFNEG